jgi:hypothetical protein
MSNDTGTVATLERRDDAKGVVQLWLDALATADKEEKDWRDEANDLTKRYRACDKAADRNVAFNIYAANVRTTLPALYNSQPTPDIRRRYDTQTQMPELPPGIDPAMAQQFMAQMQAQAKAQKQQIQDAADALERAIEIEWDSGRCDSAFRAAVGDRVRVGRGVVRVRYEPTFAKAEAPKIKADAEPVEAAEAVVWESAPIEFVPWDRFRRGPGRVWDDVPWIAFAHLLTRDDVVQLNPDIGKRITLDYLQDGAKDDNDGPKATPDVFKRALVWEIWDKEKREVVFITESHKSEPLRVEPDPLKLTGFFCIPEPMYGDRESSSLVPLTDWRLYKDQAEELDQITQRIAAMIKAIKFRGVYSGAMDSLQKLETALDGEMVPADGAPPDVDFDRAIWFWPVEKAVTVLQALYAQREMIKQEIYELSGIADIMRGSSDPNETLGAQQLKAQWGSGRVQESQRDVQRCARELIRMQCEIIAEHFSTETLSLMTGVQLNEETRAMIASDQLRHWSIDIETDSTIQADLSQAQTNIGNFLAGFAQFTQAIGPAVQAGVIPLEAATDLLAAFARTYRLGRTAEMALERIGDPAEQDGGLPGQPGQQPKPDPEAEKAQAEAEAVKAETGARVQKVQVDAQAAQMEHELKAQEMEMRRAEMQMRAVEMQLKHQVTMAELAAKQQEIAARAAVQETAGEDAERWLA